MPLVEIVGVTSTGKTFSLAYAFIVNEREANYQWVLRCLRSTLADSFAVRVVLTDRELALMRALKVVMPEAKQLLCRYHIWQNIIKHCEPALRMKKDVNIDRLNVWWKKVYQSRTFDEFKSNEKELKEKLAGFPGVYKYLTDNWLSPYREQFVSCWVDEHLNYQNHTTNRVEAEHHLLKEELRGKCTFTRILQCVDSVLISQEAEIRGQLGYNNGTRKGKHNYNCMKDLLGKVSLKALDIMADEIVRLDKVLKRHVNKCGCKVQSSCGLPCACKIAEYMQRG